MMLHFCASDFFFFFASLSLSLSQRWYCEKKSVVRDSSTPRFSRASGDCLTECR